MPYNEQIDARIAQIVTDWENTHSRRMFGGICHLFNGNIFCGVYQDFLILRLGDENANNALTLPFARPFDITGKPMRGWVMLEQHGFKSDDELAAWLNQAKDFVRTLPSK